MSTWLSRAFVRSLWVLLPLSLTVGGCLQTVPIETNPMGASVKIDDVPAGVTPLKVDLHPGNNHVVLLEKPGYRRVRVDLRSIGRTSTTFSANGTSTTSTRYRLEPRSISARLDPLEQEDTSGHGDRARVSISRLEQWQKQGVLTAEEGKLLMRLLLLRYTPPAPATATYELPLREHSAGPYTLAELVELLIAGYIHPMTPIRLRADAPTMPFFKVLEEAGGQHP